MKANEVIKTQTWARAPSIAAFVKSIPLPPLYGKFDDQNGILGEQPDKHNQSDLEVDIVFQSWEIDRNLAPPPTGNERRIDSGTK
jgi:hypothetical protein